MRNDPQSGRGQGHVTYFLNFGTSDSITFKRMNLDSSFFLCWIGHGKYYIRDDEWPQRGRGQVTCPTFEAMGQIIVFHRTYFLLKICTDGDFLISDGNLFPTKGQLIFNISLSHFSSSMSTHTMCRHTSMFVDTCGRQRHDSWQMDKRSLMRLLATVITH